MGQRSRECGERGWRRAPDTTVTGAPAARVAVHTQAVACPAAAASSAGRRGRP